MQVKPNVSSKPESGNLIGSPLEGYDYIFVGLGASASLLLLELERKELLQGARILIADPDLKNRNDKTFCFWAKDGEPIQNDLHDLISHHWTKAKIGDSEAETQLKPLRYNHISSIDLYQKSQVLIQQYGWDRITSPVHSIAQDEKGPFILLNQTKIRARRVFDSRTPDYQKPQKDEVHIFQSFIGWTIETENGTINQTAFHFMDFSIDQNGGTQFMYILPFSTHTALIEITRFGSEKIVEQEADRQLQDYIENHFGKFKKTAVETGCIPMSNCRIKNEIQPGITLLGARNYAIKPSTGYAFKNMHKHAAAIADCIQKSKEQDLDYLNKTHQKAKKGRFAFYDSLLLHILKNSPEKGKTIFTALFNKVEINKILRFLDETTSIREDISIFSKLPARPFISALFQQLRHYSWFRPMILTLLSVLLLAAGNGSHLQTISGYSLLFAGLISVGIPHGAVDHLLETGKWNYQKAPRFILTYLLQAAAMAVFWYFFPQLALWLFLGYSAWHFGQADGKQWNLSPKISFLWGSSVLFFILGTHSEESKHILASIGIEALPFDCPQAAILPWFVFASFQKRTAMGLTTLWLMMSAGLPLMLAFGLYFIGQHSFTSWNQICSHLNLSQKKVWIHSLPFHAGAWIILTAFYLFWPSASPGSNFNQWGLFFIFIASISFPHAIAMKKVYSS